MVRRSFRLSRVFLARRVADLMASLFTRRSAVRGRNGFGRCRGHRLHGWRTVGSRLARSLSIVAADTATTFSRATLRLATPECLESRKMWAGMHYTTATNTLAVWIDQPGESLEVFSQDGDGMVTVESSVTGLVFDSLVLNGGGLGMREPNEIRIYEEQFFTSALTAPNYIDLNASRPTSGAYNWGGSGYTTAPSVDLSRQADGSLATLDDDVANGQAFITPTATSGTPAITGVTSPTTGTSTFTLTQTNVPNTGTFGGPSTQNATFTWNWATGTASGFSTGFLTNLVPNGSTVTLTAGGGTAGVSGTVTALSLTGRVSRIGFTDFGDGYLGDVDVVFGSGNAERFINLSTSPAIAASTTSVEFRPPVGSVFGANPITQSIYVGASDVSRDVYNSSNTLIDNDPNVTNVLVNTPIVTPSAGRFRIVNVGNFQQSSSVTVPNGAYTLQLDLHDSDDADVGGASIDAAIEAGSVTINTRNNNVSLSAGTVRATSGGVSITVDSEGTSGSISSTSTSFIGNSVTLDAGYWVGGGAITGAIDVQLSDSDRIQATAGDVQILADEGISIAGTGDILASSDVFILNRWEGAIAIEGDQIAASGDVVARNFSANAADDVTLDAEVGGTTRPDFVSLVSDAGELTINRDVLAKSAIFLRSTQNLTINAEIQARDGATYGNVSLISGDEVLGVTTVVAERLTLTAAQAANVKITTSVNKLAATTDGTTEFTNNKSLTTEGITLLNNGNLTITTTGGSSDLTIGTPLAHAGGLLTLAAGRNLTATVAISNNQAIDLQAGGSILATTISTTGNITASAGTGIDLSGSVQADTFALYSDSGTISLRAPSNAGFVKVLDAKTSGDISLRATSGQLQVQNQVISETGSISLRADGGDVNISKAGTGVGARIETPEDRSITILAKNKVLFDANARLSTGTLAYTAAEGSSVLNTPARSSFHTLSATLTGAGKSLDIEQDGTTAQPGLNLTSVATVDGDVEVRVTEGDLTISGAVDAGTGSVNLTVTEGGVSAPFSFQAGDVTVGANRAVTFGSLSATSLNVSIAQEGENLSVVAATDLAVGTGNISVANASVSITTGSDANLTRSGEIQAGSGSVLLDVGEGGIVGTGAITTDRLEWRANAAPDPTNLTYAVLEANMTGTGDLTIARPGALTVDGISIRDGDISIDVASGSLTINGSIESRGNVADISINVPLGGIMVASNTAVIHAGALEIDAQNDALNLRTDADSLDATVTSGSLSLTEEDGLEISDVNASGNVSIALTNGSLVLTGGIKAGQTAADSVNLSVPNGTITGSGAVNVTHGSLFFTALGAPTFTGWTFTKLSAAVTGAGNTLDITSTGDLQLLGATTVSGNVSIDVNGGNGDLEILGNVTAGDGQTVSILADNVTMPGAAANDTRITAGTLTIDAGNSADLRVDVAEFEAEIANSGSLNLTALSDLEIVDAPNTTGVGVSLNNGSISLSISGNLVVSSDVLAPGSAGSVSLNTTGTISHAPGSLIETTGPLALDAGGDVSLRTKVASVSGKANGSISLIEVEDLDIDAAGLEASGDLSLELQSGDLGGTGNLTSTGGDLDLNVALGNVTLTGVNQVTGGHLEIRALEASINTSVDSLAANLTGDLTLSEADGLDIGPAGVRTGGNIAITVANGALAGTGILAADGGLDDISLDVAGPVTLDGVNQIVAADLTVVAGGSASLGTDVVRIDAEVSGDLTIVEHDDLEIANATTTGNGSIAITAGGDIDGTGPVDADNGAGNVTLNAGGSINLSGVGQIIADRLALTAGNGATVGTDVAGLAADVTGSLVVSEMDDLEIDAAHVITSGGDLSLTVGGNLAGTGDIRADGGAGNVVLDASSGNIVLNAAGQIQASLLTVTTEEATLGTAIDTLVANVTVGDLILSESDGLEIGADNVAVVGEINLTVLAGNLAGPGVISTDSNAISIDVAGGVNLASAATEQIRGSLLTITAGEDVVVNVTIDELEADVAGNLTVTETDDLEIGEGNVSAGLSIGIDAGGDIGGLGDLVANDVSLVANAINLPDPAQVRASLLDAVTTGGNATLSTDIDALTANVAGDLTVTEVDSLVIGLSAASEVRAGGNVAISLLTAGDLSGNGSINATGNVTIDLASRGNVSLTAGQIRGEVLAATTAEGSIAVNTAVANVALELFGAGDVTVTEADDLTVDQILALQGAVDLTLATGDLTIDSGSILGGQISNVSLTVLAGGISSSDAATGDFGVVTGNVLSIVAQNSSTLNTSVTELRATITGANESLAIFEEDGIDYANRSTPGNSVAVPSDGLTIGPAGVTTAGGDVSLTIVDDPVANIAGGSLVIAGAIDTLDSATNATGNVTIDVQNGSINTVAPLGVIRGNVLTLEATENSAVATDVAVIQGQVSADLTVVEADDLEIGAPGLTTTDNGSISIETGGSLAITGDIDADSGNGVVELIADGNVTGDGLVTASTLGIGATGSASVNTSIDAIVAIVGGSLDVVEADDLSIVEILAGENVSIELTSGDLTGTGPLLAGDDISLNVSAGSITLDAIPDQVEGARLEILAQNASSLNTSVDSLSADITGVGESLTIIEEDDLEIAAPEGVSTNDGDVSIATGGDLTITGPIDAVTATISLDVDGDVSGPGLVTGGRLDVVAAGNASLTTNVTEMNASVGGDFAITQSADFQVALPGIQAGGDIDITVSAGNLSGPGNIVAGGDVAFDVNLSIDLADRTAQVQGSLLTLTAGNTSQIETRVTSVAGAITTGGETLTIREQDDLTIANSFGAQHLDVEDGEIDLTVGGSLILAGDIDARASGNVTLDVAGGITTSGGRVRGFSLELEVGAVSSVGTDVDEIEARLTGASSQSLTINELNGLDVVGTGITTTGGALTITLAAGDLEIGAPLSATGSGTVTLAATAGSITSAGTSRIVASTLALTARDTSNILTTVTFLTGRITGIGESLIVDERDALVIGDAGIVTNDGDVTLTVGNPSRRRLTLTGGIDAGAGDVTIDAYQLVGAGLVAADALDVTLAITSAVSTAVTSVVGEITGVNARLSITEADDLEIGSTDLDASGSGGRLIVSTGGNLTGPGNISAASGTSSITLTVGGELAMDGSIDAGASGSVLITSGGGVSMNAPAQITARVLTLTAGGDVDIGTQIDELSATVTGDSATLTVTEYDGLFIRPNTARTSNGRISLTSGDQAAGDLEIGGPVNAGSNDVVLASLDGNITGSGTISGRNLDITVNNGSAAVRTAVSGIAAAVTTSGETLSVVETDSLTILPAGIDTNDGDVALTLSSGSLTGEGSVDAGTANVSIAAAQGAVTFSGSGTITGSLLTIGALGPVVVNTRVDAIDATTTGAALDLTVVETGDIAIDSIETNGGDVSVSATGDITGAGSIEADGGDVSLSAGGNITLSGDVTGGDLTVIAGGDAAINTSVDSITADVDGTLEILETDGLAIAPAGVSAGIATIRLESGDLTGTGSILTPGQLLTLVAEDGSILLASKAGQIVADSLNVSASVAAALQTNIGSIVADQAGSLTVTEVSGLDIGAAGIDTSDGDGDVSITVTKGNLSGNGISAGAGDITLAAPLGEVQGGVYQGEGLTITSRSGIDVETNVATIDARVAYIGSIDVRQAGNLTVERAETGRSGDITLNITGPGDLTLRTITARGRPPAGDVTLITNDGDVSIEGILTAADKLDVTGVNGVVRVQPTGAIRTSRAAGSVVQNPGDAIEWVVNSSANTGIGSFRNAVTNINAFQGQSAINVTSPLTVNLTSTLPAFTRSVWIQGNDGTLTLSAPIGKNSVTGITLRADGSTIDGVRFQNFGGTALVFQGGSRATTAVDIRATDLEIVNSQVGVRATGFFKSGSIFEDSMVDAANRVGSYGVVLSNAREFTVEDNDIIRAQIGVSLAGRSEGSLVRSNRLSGRDSPGRPFGYGISLAKATGVTGNFLTVDSNQIDNFLFGVFASGYCTYSEVIGTTFGDLEFDDDSTGIESRYRYNVSRSRNLRVVS
jgi:hypothetical protein